VGSVDGRARREAFAAVGSVCARAEGGEVAVVSTTVAGGSALAEDLEILELDNPGRRRPLSLSWRGRPLRVWRFVVLAIAGLYFLVPLWAGFRYSLAYNGTGFSVQAYSGLANEAGFGAAIWLSVQLALITTAVTMVLMVPTTVYIHLRLPQLKRVMDFITALPLVIPPVVLILGVLDVAPARLKATPYLLALEYVVLAVPFAYRSLDAGVRALDLRTLVDASRSLGGGIAMTMRTVLLPNMRSAILSATVLTVALVLGEYTMASLDQFQTFPVWIVLFEDQNSHVSVAASMLALLLTWAVLIAISLVGRSRRSSEGDE
jgi:putative spermidine/putrescine transport system permease protein